MMKNGRFEFRNIPFYGFATFHDDEHGKKRGPNTMYRLTAEGITLCHCGDLGAIPDNKVINAIKEVDFLLVPVGGVYTMEKDVLRREYVFIIKGAIAAHQRDMTCLQTLSSLNV